MHWNFRIVQSILALVPSNLKPCWNLLSPDEFSLNDNISLCIIYVPRITFVPSKNACDYSMEEDWDDWNSFSNFSRRRKHSVRCSCTLIFKTLSWCKPIISYLMSIVLFSRGIDSIFWVPATRTLSLGVFGGRVLWKCPVNVFIILLRIPFIRSPSITWLFWCSWILYLTYFHVWVEENLVDGRNVDSSTSFICHSFSLFYFFM